MQQSLRTWRERQMEEKGRIAMRNAGGPPSACQELQKGKKGRGVKDVTRDISGTRGEWFLDQRRPGAEAPVPALGPLAHPAGT